MVHTSDQIPFHKKRTKWFALSIGAVSLFVHDRSLNSESDTFLRDDHRAGEVPDQSQEWEQEGSCG